MNRRREKILIRNCIAGRPDSQKELYDFFSNDMFKVCRSYAPDFDTANDYLQEGFLKIFQNLHKYKPTGSLGGWMRKLMINSCIDMIRKDIWNTHKIPFEEYMAGDYSPGQDLNMRSINTDSFFEVLSKLPMGYRTVLNLYFVEDYKHHEIAEILNISVGTSKSQLSKAKRYLKDILLRDMSIQELELYVGQLVKEVV